MARVWVKRSSSRVFEVCSILWRHDCWATNVMTWQVAWVSRRQGRHAESFLNEESSDPLVQWLHPLITWSHSKRVIITSGSVFLSSLLLLWTRVKVESTKMKCLGCDVQCVCTEYSMNDTSSSLHLHISCCLYKETPSLLVFQRTLRELRVSLFCVCITFCLRLWCVTYSSFTSTSLGVQMYSFAFTC